MAKAQTWNNPRLGVPFDYFLTLECKSSTSKARAICIYSYDGMLYIHSALVGFLEVAQFLVFNLLLVFVEEEKFVAENRTEWPGDLLFRA